MSVKIVSPQFTYINCILQVKLPSVSSKKIADFKIMWFKTKRLHNNLYEVVILTKNKIRVN